METLTKKSSVKKNNKKNFSGYFSLKMNIKNAFPLHFGSTHGDECSECIEEYEGQILYDAQGDDKTVLVGKFAFTIFNATRAMNKRFSPVDTFDVGSEPTEFYQLIYDYGTYSFNDFLEEAIGDDAMGSNSAYISIVQILPEYRGIGLCKKVLNSIINFLEGKADIVVMKSFPLQHQPFVKEKRESEEKTKWCESMGYYSDLSKISLADSQKKLNDLYTSYGFKKIKLPKDWTDSEDSYFGLNLTMTKPLLEDNY